MEMKGKLVPKLKSNEHRRTSARAAVQAVVQSHKSISN